MIRPVARFPHKARAFSGCLSFLLLAALPPSAFSEDSGLRPDAPIERFRVYGFDDDTGWRAWQIEGSRAEFLTNGSVQVRDMRLRVFEANDAQKVDLSITSPLATMPPARDKVEGPGVIVMEARGFFLGGEGWTWHTKEKTLSIAAKAHTVIDGELGPILE